MRDRVTVPSIAVRKRSRGAPPIVMVTAYDTPFARIVDDAGVDIILVGDSVGNNVLGYENSLAVDVGQMVHHVGAVARANPSALIVGDLPWMSYHVESSDTVRNAAALVRAGAQAVKLEGGRRRIPAVRAILDSEIPVMGHLGLTPQSLHAMGGFAVQGKHVEAARQLELDARVLSAAGCFAIVLEGVPDLVASRVTAAIEIPTIGIGAGPACDGQVLVLHDLLGLSGGHVPKFVRQYADLTVVAREAITRFAADVRSGSYPSPEETYHATPDLERELKDAPQR
ncbi:MAG TPA: 3-methyl-2-oxobutanoate hydroxymethyltransferase [Acidimicrobiales bacterium]|nr:3-methyl-2-oxobutanoate hydroxymethyltransferase [Acidimicrobiales bacterium]